MAFLFNWIGFLLCFCLTTSVTGRHGAISGFDLSLFKWVLIVMFSPHFPGYFAGQYWVWWVLLILGFHLVLRGFISYDARNFLSLALLIFMWSIQFFVHNHQEPGPRLHLQYF